MSFEKLMLERTRAVVLESLRNATKDQLTFEILWAERDRAVGLTAKELAARIEEKLSSTVRFRAGSTDTASSKEEISEAAVRRHVMSLKNHLDRLFSSPGGRRLPCRITFPDSRPGRRSAGHYKLSVENSHPIAKLLWGPYLSDTPTVIVFNQPQFYRGDSDNRFLLRDLDVNKDDLTSLLQKRSFLSAVPKLHAVRHYVGRGDVDLLVSLVRWFADNGVLCETTPMHDRRWMNLQANLILIGNARTFPDLATRLRERTFSFAIETHGISNANPKAGEERFYHDEFSESACGIITRYYDKPRGHFVTAVCSNHTSFFAGVADELVVEPKTSGLLRWMLDDDETAFIPEEFEVLLRYGCAEGEALRGEVEHLGKRLGPIGRTSSHAGAPD